MAVIHKGHNTLKDKARKYFALSLLFWTPLVVYMIAFTQGFYFDGIYHLFPLLFGVVGSYYSQKYSTIRSGIKGEVRTSKLLENLPHGYEIFSSIHLSTSIGTAEYDHVIVSENGVFVIEVKNHNGHIVGHEEEHSWTQHKVGRKGGRYQKDMRNPIKQVRRQVHILSRYFKENNVTTWIEGVVYFSNPKVVVDVRTDRTPVFTSSDELRDYLLKYEPRKKLTTIEMEKVKKLLASQLMNEKKTL